MASQDGCISCRTEFKPSNFLLSYDRPREFFVFQCGGRIPYLVWRIFWMLYHTVWIILTGVYSYQWAGPDPAQQIKWFIYLTDWSYFMLTTSSIVQCICIVFVNVKRKDVFTNQPEMTWYMKANWVFLNVSNTASITVAILYWSLIYSSSAEMTAVNIETHGINLVYSLLNLLVSAYPIRVFHMIHGMTYGLAYVLFSLFYQIGGGTNENGKNYIYSTLDWSNTGYTIGLSVGVVLFAIPVIHLVCYGLFRFRIWIHVKCCSSREERDIEMDAK